MIDPQIFNIQTDSFGHWDLQIDNTFSEEMHTAILTNDVGDKDIALFAITKTPPPRLAPRIQTIEPPMMMWVIILLSIILILLSVYNTYLSKTLDELQKKKYPYKFTFSLISLIFGIFMLIGSMFFLWKGDFTEPYADWKVLRDSEILLTQVTGRVLDPLSLEGVSGVDLTVGDVHVKTEDGGAFAFYHITENNNIKINHPFLTRALIQKIEQAKTLDIYFEPKLYNQLIYIVNLEAQQKYDEIYRQLASSVQEKIDQDTFVATYEPLFSAKNLSDQVLRIENTLVYTVYASAATMLEFSDVMQITVSTNQGNKTFQFALIEGEWKLIE